LRSRLQLRRRLGHRQPADRCRGIGQRLQARDQLLHLPFAPVLCRRKHLDVIRVRQMRREQPHARQVQSTIGELLQHHRKLAGRPCGLDPPVRGALGEEQNSRAVHKQRRAAFSEVQPPLVENGEVRDEVRRRIAFVLCQVFHLGQKSRVRKRFNRSKLSVHDGSVSRGPATSCERVGAHGWDVKVRDVGTLRFR
jgi:hypothetical protein